MRIALIHDCIVHIGGAERVLPDSSCEAPCRNLIQGFKLEGYGRMVDGVW